MEGIWVNDAGNVAETCMGNVAIVDQEGALRSPHYDGSILAGTTLLRAFTFAPQLVQVETGRVAKPVVFSSWISQSSVCSRISYKNMSIVSNRSGFTAVGVPVSSLPVPPASLWCVPFYRKHRLTHFEHPRPRQLSWFVSDNSAGRTADVLQVRRRSR